MIDKEVRIPADLAMEIKRAGLDTEQVLSVIDDAENGGLRVFDESEGIYYAHEKTGSVTIWVSYTKNPGNIDIKSVYSHRMDIKENRE
ncbi:MAG: hypothetical protein J5528_02935 [Firmicutes bacterium]|nr:hypothetical protein [Bacillota bacterium]